MNPTSTSTTAPNPSAQSSPFDNHMLIFSHEDAMAWEEHEPSLVPMMVPQADLAPNMNSSVDLTFGHDLEHYREGETAHHSSWTDGPLSNDISSTGFQSQINYQLFDWQNNHFVGQWSDSGPMDRVDVDGGEGYRVSCEDPAPEPHTSMTRAVMTDRSTVTYFDIAQATSLPLTAQSDITAHDHSEFIDTAQQDRLHWDMARHYPTSMGELYHQADTDTSVNLATPSSAPEQGAPTMYQNHIVDTPVNDPESQFYNTTNVICVAEKATKKQNRNFNPWDYDLDAEGSSGSPTWTVNQEQCSDFERSPVDRSETPIENEFTFPTTVSEGGVGMSTPGTSDVRKASSSSLPRRKPHPAGIRKQKTKNTASEKIRWYTNREGKVIPVSRGYRSDLVP